MKKDKKRIYFFFVKSTGILFLEIFRFNSLSIKRKYIPLHPH